MSATTPAEATPDISLARPDDQTLFERALMHAREVFICQAEGGAALQAFTAAVIVLWVRNSDYDSAESLFRACGLTEQSALSTLFEHSCFRQMTTHLRSVAPNGGADNETSPARGT